MQTWAKYALSFFVLILVLTGFIYAFGPQSTRNAFNSGETQTGQLRADHQLVNPGEAASSAPADATQPATVSGTSQPALPGAPAGRLQAQPQGPSGLVDSPSNISNGDQSGNQKALPAK